MTAVGHGWSNPARPVKSRSPESLNVAIPFSLGREQSLLGRGLGGAVSDDDVVWLGLGHRGFAQGHRGRGGRRGSALALISSGTYLAGALYDHFGYYAPAFAAGIGSNILNLMVVGTLVLRQRWRTA